jgi:hypothetical protein
MSQAYLLKILKSDHDSLSLNFLMSLPEDTADLLE